MHGIDLHTHSNISDGTLSPEALVHAAVAAGVHTLALTDHDNMDGIQRAKACSMTLEAPYSLRIIPGVEISSQWSRPATKKSYGVHVVALGMQNPAPLLQMLEQQKRIRAARARHICHLLTDIIQVDIYEQVLALVEGEPDRITRTHIAKALVQQQIVSRPQQAFDRYLKEGKKAFVNFEGLGLAETIQVIHASRGFAVLAHPTRYTLSATNIRYLVELFAESGGDAIELPPASDPTSTRQMIDRLIQQYALKVSIGSDYHGENMPWLKLGNVPSLRPDQIGIWESFSL
ncbi:MULTISPECIES: PHP domain-containing protein [Acinetobacter]|jgi:predicted metal-dependent phosphoesterase TrpH|uniref:PHP domain-containing protein n=1 Tax=Acinetobacter radioresistens TaxID=40216 RepID=A0A2T1IWW3_ACIRA|nr:MULTISPECIES: PHP domain-containing protein [Acinetobacter]ENV85396.1 hypothetical protein F939_02915 [Acinetobacter radioresistens DSM 6976 = NBRC 102413 = CIP 103788]EXB31745.1 PHP domain protein [Acinetobacter sp. 1461402]EXB69444.1 PHP domain protein [Acinetobacter sp. 230853]EXE13202.1 PHP domain protein [Acinetobacter sp. 983759]KCX36263.1 PHP domain protein [Acinetobacter sp. 263903-1]